MNRKIVLAAALMGSSILLPAVSVNVAHAQESNKDKALDAYEKGDRQYNLGRWTAAIALFEQAYSLDPDAAYLFNIAQAYRQADDCKQAAFFYKRYLSINTSAPNRTQVEGYIQDLDEACRNRAQSNLTPPDNKDPNGKDPNGGNSGVNNSGTKLNNGTAIKSDPVSDGTQVAALTGNDPSTTASIETPVEAEDDGPSLLVAHAYLGPSMMNFSYVDEMRTGDLSAVRGNITLGVGYPLQLGPVHVDVGALLSASTYKWVSGVGTNEVRGTVGLTSTMANFGARYEVIDKLMIRGEFGLGALLITGLDEAQNPFTVRPGSALFARFTTRIAIGAEYALTENLAVSVSPLVLRIATAPTEDFTVKAFNSVQSLFGIRYSL